MEEYIYQNLSRADEFSEKELSTFILYMYPPITLTGILALDETVILLIRLLIIGFVCIFWIVAIPTVPHCSVICYYPYSLLFMGYLFSGIKWVS